MDEILAKRYADAFIKYAQERIGIERVVEDCRNMKLIISGNPELIELLKAPQLTFSEKNEIIDNLLSRHFTEEFLRLLKLLLRKGRIEKLADIAEYVRVNYSYGARAQVLLKTSYPIELDLVRKAIEGFKEKFGRDIKLYIDLDGSLLGGLKAVSGNTIIDGSVKKRLLDLKKQLREIRMA